VLTFLWSGQSQLFQSYHSHKISGLPPCPLFSLHLFKESLSPFCQGDRAGLANCKWCQAPSQLVGLVKFLRVKMFLWIFCYSVVRRRR
jgi:hypothetical protein